MYRSTSGAAASAALVTVIVVFVALPLGDGQRARKEGFIVVFSRPSRIRSIAAEHARAFDAVKYSPQRHQGLRRGRSARAQR
jgi:hypothetical protein